MDNIETKMNRVVITGPTGAIGLALIRKCVADGVHVLAICRKGSANIKYIAISKYVEIVECDLEDLMNFSINGTYDVFYHFAWKGTIGDARNDINLQKENIQFTLDAVELAKRLGCHTFIGAGSQAEYGRYDCLLTPDTPARPENEYGYAKLMAGELSRERCGELGIKHIWVRILSVYGPYDDENTMVMSTILTMLKGETPKCTEGIQKWDFLYSGDAANAFFKLGEAGRNGKIYCLGSGETRPIRDYIGIITSIVNPNCEVEYGSIPYNHNQVMHLGANIDDLVKDVGFSPEISFADGVKKILNSISKE